ncbi:MAG: hypothetical protein IJW03_05080 [Clostridia bacterium]|nr:hypothetical protein [Clostridia bacterium]
MIRRKRALLVSGAIILLCMSIIVGMTYALFTDDFLVLNHLKAGRLNVTLERTYLEYCILDDDGLLSTMKDETLYDFTHAKAGNIFGESATDVRIAPGSYFEATLRVTNDDHEGDESDPNFSNVAFSYKVALVFRELPNDLAKQIKVTLTDDEDKTHEMMLADIYDKGAYEFEAGSLLVGDKSEEFKVRVEFVDSFSDEYTGGDSSKYYDNDLAQGESTSFDLVVYAVQATTPTP